MFDTGLSDSKFKVTELWSGQSMGTKAGSISASVGAHDLTIFRLDPVA